MKSQGVGATEIAKALGIGRASVYRPLEAAGDTRSWPGNQASFMECGSGETIDALERHQRIRREGRLEPA
jgi:hypothetical protein